MTLVNSMSWEQLNEVVKQYGYFFSNLTNVILKNGRIVAHIKSKQQAINYVIDRVAR